MKQTVAGTTMFDGAQAQKGYALNRMCYSFNAAENREAFLRDEDAYCAKFGLNEAQRAAIRNRNVAELIAAGGNIYYLAKFAGIFGLDVAATPLSAVMTPSPQTIAPDKPFGSALLVMHESGFRHLPVVEKGKLVGIVSARFAMDPDLEEFTAEAERREYFRKQA